MINPLLLRDIVETVLRNHPPECIFAPNAIESIIADVQSKGAQTREELIAALEGAVKAHEIYCPHEGIGKGTFK